MKTADIAAASAYDQSDGIGSSSRTSPATSVPLPSGKNPYTWSPTANSVTPGPTSTTTPAPSPPISASWVNMPRVIMMSRKLVAMARMRHPNLAGFQAAHRRWAPAPAGGSRRCPRWTDPAATARRPGAPGCRPLPGCRAPARCRSCHRAARPAARRPTRRLDDRRITQWRIGIHQHDPAGMLGLRRAHQTPYRRARQIGDVLARQPDSPAGRHHQHA